MTDGMDGTDHRRLKGAGHRFNSNSNAGLHTWNHLDAFAKALEICFHKGPGDVCCDVNNDWRLN